MANVKKELMWTLMFIIFRRIALNLECRDWALCLTPCRHMCVTLGKTLSLLEPEVLTPRTFVRIKEANVYEKYFVICKMVYTC